MYRGGSATVGGVQDNEVYGTRRYETTSGVYCLQHRSDLIDAIIAVLVTLLMHP